MKIYRVAIQGMYGLIQESFYTDITIAEKAYEDLIIEKKKDENTLSDSSCADECMGEKNFLEYESKDVLKGVHWAYGYNQSNENGTEFYSYTDEIILQEVYVKD